MVHSQMEPTHPSAWLGQAVGDQIDQADDKKMAAPPALE